MNAAIETRDFLLEPADNTILANLCGQFDEHLRQIEKRLDVHISNRGNHFRVAGTAAAADLGVQVIQELYELAGEESLDSRRVHICLQETAMTNDLGGADSNTEQSGPQAVPGDDDVIVTRRARIKPRGPSQCAYVASMRQSDLSFGIGPAGTGKTYLAVARAVEALDREEVRRIVLVRPAVEAGERLGFLPGDMSQKVDPYLRPMYDALYEMIGFDRVARLIEKNVIEIAPLAFMRGRSLNESFIILDEAQNTTVEQMKMFLTRMGYGSRAVVTGDVTQIDLPRHQISGLRHVLKVLREVDGVSFSFFSARDVVRHSLVQRIVEAYQGFEADAWDADAE
ncbi:MAG: PhoH family protein [Gammaproteobacteria bacterium]|nr:PhoH family protein [Gammaproteobacteria bacterium]NND53364.1 PhoH family protein [Gammaproteobacteria bacterium]